MLTKADQLLSARLAHLGMIQGIVSRLATFSANAKNFCVTVVAALLGIAFQQHLPSLLLGAAFVTISFAALDIYYLAQERRFRRFYGEVAKRPLADAEQLDLTPVELSLPEYLRAVRSFSTGGFYLLLLIVGIVVLLVSYGRSAEATAGNTGRAASSAGTIRAEQSASVAAGTGAEGSGASTIEPVRNNQSAARPNSVSTERPIQDPATRDRRTVRQPVANSAE